MASVRCGSCRKSHDAGIGLVGRCPHCGARPRVHVEIGSTSEASTAPQRASDRLRPDPGPRPSRRLRTSGRARPVGRVQPVDRDDRPAAAPAPTTERAPTSSSRRRRRASLLSSHSLRGGVGSSSTHTSPRIGSTSGTAFDDGPDPERVRAVSTPLLFGAALSSVGLILMLVGLGRDLAGNDELLTGIIALVHFTVTSSLWLLVSWARGAPDEAQVPCGLALVVTLGLAAWQTATAESAGVPPAAIASGGAALALAIGLALARPPRGD